MFEAIIDEACTAMLYMAAETVRDRTVLEFREFQPTWIACALELISMCMWKGRYAVDTHHLGNQVVMS